MAVVMIIITGVPYLFGYLSAPEGTEYNGLHALSPGDIPVYYSYINQVKEGDFFVKNLFTSEPQGSGTFNVWWFWVGLLAKVFNLSLVIVFQLSRLLMIPVFLAIAYLFISFFIIEKLKRKICLLFLLFSGGLGAYFAAGIDQLNIKDGIRYPWPIDLWLTEAVTFNTLYQTSHFIASIVFTFLIFLFILLAFEKNKSSYVIVSGLLALVYFNFHPYYVPVIYGVAGLYLFILILQARKILWHKIGYLMILVLLSLPSIIYHFVIIKQNPVIAQRAAQNITYISPVFFVIIGYGFLWLGLILGLVFLLKNKKFNNRFVFLLTWLVVNLALIYSPFPFHSRYTQGIHFILVVFTVIGLFGFYDYLKTKLKPKIFDFWVNNVTLWIILFIFLFGTTSAYMLVRDFYYFSQKPGNIKTSLYLPKDFTTATQWLSVQQKPSLVLSSALTSSFIPAFSGQPVYVAHGHETLFFYSKIIHLAYLFQDNNEALDKIKHDFLLKENIDFILYSDYEKELGSFIPAQKNYLQLVFDSPQVQVYQVVK